MEHIIIYVKKRTTTLFPYAARTYSQIGKQVGKARKRNQPTAKNYILVSVLLEMADRQAETETSTCQKSK